MFLGSLSIRSSQAHALRAKLQLSATDPSALSSPESVIRFRGSNNDIFEDTISSYTHRAHWTPVVSGELMVIEIQLPSTVSPSQFTLSVSNIAHITHSISDTLDKKISYDFINRSQPCELDVACKKSPTPGFVNASNAVARMIVSDDMFSYLCSGTLLNNNNEPIKALFYTATHCIQNHDVAESLQTYWFYQRKECSKDSAIKDVVTLTGGAKLLYANNTTDIALLELNYPPPVGAYYAGWNAEPITEANTLQVTGLHHPRGDVKKYSLGTLQNLAVIVDGQHIFYQVKWSAGMTEEGSSGSGLFIPDETGDYLLRGGLYGGNASSCSVNTGFDYYSRLSDGFKKIKRFLK